MCNGPTGGGGDLLQSREWNRFVCSSNEAESGFILYLQAALLRDSAFFSTAQMAPAQNSNDEELLRKIRETVDYMSFAVKKDTTVSGSVRFSHSCHHR